MFGMNMNIIRDPNMTETKIVERTWKERLFSLPWTPFKKHNIINVPSENFYVVGNTVICHPSMYKKLVGQMNENEIEF